MGLYCRKVLIFTGICIKHRFCCVVWFDANCEESWDQKRAENLICKSKASASDVLYKLFNSYCMSLYGSQLWNYENKSGMDSLYIAWRKCVRRIFNILCNTHCELVPLICKDSAIHNKLYKRFLRFFINAKKSENSSLSIMTKHVLSGSSSKACKTLNFICYTYNIQNKYTIS